MTGLGALAVTMENGGADEFYEAAYPQRPDWPEIDVTGMFERSVDAPGLASAIRSMFPGCSQHDIASLEDQDWENLRPSRLVRACGSSPVGWNHRMPVPSIS